MENNEYIYLIYEMGTNDFDPYVEFLYITNNIMEFLEFLVNMPLFTDVTILITNNGKQEEYNSLSFKFDYEFYTHVRKRYMLNKLIDKLTNTKYTIIDDITRNTIITYIWDYIEETDFDELDKIRVADEQNRVNESKMNQLNKLAKELGYKLVKEERTWG